MARADRHREYRFNRKEGKKKEGKKMRQKEGHTWGQKPCNLQIQEAGKIRYTEGKGNSPEANIDKEK